jgi:hypothetical protein
MASLPSVWHARAAEETPRVKVAAVITTFFFRSHAHVILENFLNPYYFNGKRTEPGVDVVAFYVDQFHEQDMARDVAEKYGIPIYPTIAEALCRGGSELAVDAVLAIGEHGDYPVSEKGQREYPRKRFFDEIVAVFEKSGRVAPVFNDKHLSFRFDWAREMYETARRMEVPLMAGSSVPLAQRRPTLELSPGAKVVEAVSVHGGPVESYDFHGLEVLESMVEARHGGEAGIASVQFLEGDALWNAAEQGLWSPELAHAALEAELGPRAEPLPELIASLQPATGRRRRQSRGPHGILLEHRDGLRSLMLAVGRSSTRWDFACRVEGEPQPQATSFYTGPWQNRCLFKALSHAIQTHFRQRQAPYPVERTLLTTGTLDAAMTSRQKDGQRIETPELAIAYQAKDYRAMREMGESWKIITEDTPEPQGFGTLA